MKKNFYLLLFLLGAASCSTERKDFNDAVNTININDLRNHVAELGSDRYLGRMPFSEGERLSVNYLAEQLRNTGFEPAFGGSYFQKVPMVEISSSVSDVVITGGSGPEIRFKAPDEAAVVSPVEIELVSARKMAVVFAGFGIVAPEYGWNDYEGLDVKDKVVVVMINDPGLYTGDPGLFRGREMTYYGRWTYKYAEAARQGAAGILIIHETEGAGYAFTIPRKSSITPRLYMTAASDNEPRCFFTGWLNADAADKLFGDCGLCVDSIRKESCKRGFRGFALNRQVTLDIRNRLKYDESANVAGILRGSEKPDECIVYTAHWDHLGIGEQEHGDSIYNGAVDNGTSMAWALSIGKAFSSLRNRPAKSVILLFPTAEEQGLLGTIYYTGNPVIPMEKTVACFNNDGLLPIGRMKDVTITGYGQSDLDSLAALAASEQDRYIVPDPDAHTGMYFRSDHFAFVMKGVPSLYAQGSTESVEHGREWAAEQKRDYIANRYHRPADNYYPETFNFEGIAEDAALAFRIGYDLVNSDFRPQWRENSEFRKLKK